MLKRCLTDGTCEADRSSQADEAVKAVVMRVCASLPHLFFKEIPTGKYESSESETKAR